MCGKFARARLVAATFPISQAGLQFRRPTASLGLMAGVEGLWKLDACLPEKIAAPLLPSMSMRSFVSSPSRIRSLSSSSSPNGHDQVACVDRCFGHGRGNFLVMFDP